MVTGTMWIKEAQSLQAKIEKAEGQVLELRLALGKIVKESGLSVRKFEEATGVSKSSASRALNAYEASLVSKEALAQETEKQKHKVTPLETILKLLPKLSVEERKQLLNMLNK